MTSRHTDYTSNYSRHHTLTKLHSEPENDGINRVHNQTKANLTSVTSDLGGGSREYLDICLSALQYSSIPTTFYIRTVHPGTIAPVRATYHETVTLRDDWNRALELYKEIVLVEKAIKHQIIESIDERYVKNWLTKPPA